MRDRILDEIRRIVRETGRIPGVRAFELGSGILRREWQGKIWARWSDAVLEAGFEPNTLTQKLDSGFVAAEIAQCCLEIGKLPTGNDLRLYNRKSLEFPSINTIANHFPKKSIMVEALRKLAETTDKYSSILPYLPAALRNEERARSSVAEGYVYLVKSGDFYKVGRSDAIERRIKEIRVALPEAAILEHVIKTDDPPGIEAYWHRRFADRRQNGEWFRLSKPDVLAFKRRKFQ